MQNHQYKLVQIRDEFPNIHLLVAENAHIKPLEDHAIILCNTDGHTFENCTYEIVSESGETVERSRFDPLHGTRSLSVRDGTLCVINQKEFIFNSGKSSKHISKEESMKIALTSTCYAPHVAEIFGKA